MNSNTSPNSAGGPFALASKLPASQVRVRSGGQNKSSSKSCVKMKRTVNVMRPGGF